MSSKRTATLLLPLLLAVASLEASAAQAQVQDAGARDGGAADARRLGSQVSTRRAEGESTGEADPGANDGVLTPPVIVPSPEPIHLRVAMAGNPPFVVQNGDSWEGISVETWREIAERNNATYELIPYPNVTGALGAVQVGDVDVAIGPISITAQRAQRVAFTQPYFESAISIASKAGGESWLGRFTPFLSRAFLAGAGVLLLVLTLVGTLLWLAERGANPEQFPRRPLPGIANGVWLAVVTMTTVGYGDRVPLTPRGRVIAGVWMLLAMLSASSFTAFLATALTLSQIGNTTIETAQDLDGRVVAVPAGTTSVAFVRRFAGRAVQVDGLDEALRMVHRGEAAAAVFDWPALAYELEHDPDLDVALSERKYEPVGYGFAVAIGSELRAVIDVALLELRESNRLESINSEWLGTP